jgi:serine/threonine protein kinase
MPLSTSHFFRNAARCRTVPEYPVVTQFETAFGRYRLDQRLDEVEGGETYLAKLVGIEGFEKPVVLWHLGRARMRDRGFRDAVRLEAERGASLSHAGVAQVLDLGVADGRWFVTTEHVGGHTLAAVLRVKGELPWPIAAHIANEAAGALSYAHGMRRPNGELLRLVHRKLCPARIELSSGGDVKISGFGISWACRSLDTYRAPEEGRHEPIDGRADVFALGAILRRSLPRAGVPDALRHLVDQTMRPYPEQRPTAGELRNELTRILHARRRPVTPRELTGQTVNAIAARAADFAAIERLEMELDEMPLGTRVDARMLLDLYERLGWLCVEARVGARGAIQMTRALDLADGLGRDDYAALFCTLQGELLAQANRTDESRDWLERAAALRS